MCAHTSLWVYMGIRIDEHIHVELVGMHTLKSSFAQPLCQSSLFCTPCARILAVHPLYTATSGSSRSSGPVRYSWSERKVRRLSGAGSEPDGEDRAHLERRSSANESCLKGDRICRHCNEDNSHIRILCRDQLLECLILRRPMLYDLYSASNNQGGFLLVILYTSCFVTFLSQICWLD